MKLSRYSHLHGLREHTFCMKHSNRCLCRIKLKGIIVIIVILIFLYISQMVNHLYETDFAQFQYPYEGNIENYVMQLRENKTPSKLPINEYNYEYISDCMHKCSDRSPLRLVILVKSAMPNFERRYVIRRTWGYEKRFSDVKIRTVFLLGTGSDETVQDKITKEHLLYQDIVQANFTDAYFNNTIKTMMGFKWVVTKCPYAKYYFFGDDDMYISVRNLLRYVRHPTKYPEYLTDIGNTINNEILHRSKRQLVDFDLPDGIRFFSGYVKKASPFRNIFSKWHMPLEEYKYDSYPLYPTAGAYVLSIDALIDMYYASYYTKHFRLDDVYLGILAYKIGILPYHSKGFNLFKVKYSSERYKYLIASHGYDNPKELLRIWSEQKELGNA